MALYGGWRSVRALWPMLLVAGGSFAAVAIRRLELPRLRADRRALLARLADRARCCSCRSGSPRRDPEFAIARSRWRAARQGDRRRRLAGLAALADRLGDGHRLDLISAIAAIGQQKIQWPGLHKAISITLYNGKPYAAVWTFQPLGTGTAILLAAIITALLVRPALGELSSTASATTAAPDLARGRHRDADHRPRLSDELFGHRLYARQGRRLDRAACSSCFRPSSAGSPCMLSGSDTSGNALFGNLQVVAARQLNLNPVLFAATNSSGGVMGKMISPQNIATGVSVTNLKGQEGVVFARTFMHSIVLTLSLGLLVALQQFLIPWIIPVVPGP